jgi:Xaa-Pro dipeptidase
MHRNPFSEAEIARRIELLRRELAARGLEGAVIAQPESVFYLTGLDHWGYFAPHLLIIAGEGVPVLVTRNMERVSVERQVKSALFCGHSDTETAADEAARVLQDNKLLGKRLGLEYSTAGLSHGLALALQSQAKASWRDISGLIDGLRLIKSSEEQALLRAAAKVSDAAAAAAIAAICDGASEADVAAQCLAAMMRAGGHPPGFGPFLRPASRLGEEHATWGDGRYRSGEPVFVELSGCVGRYHAPLGRLIRIGGMSDDDARMAEITRLAFGAAVAALKPGVCAGEVYATWQAVVDGAGLPHYRRHHCGYSVGIGVPPSWTGGNKVTGLAPGSHLRIEAGMSFHVLSWLMGTGRGDDFISNTVLVTAQGAKVLNRTPAGPIIR